jgi:hypothetical protein
MYFRLYFIVRMFFWNIFHMFSIVFLTRRMVNKKKLIATNILTDGVYQNLVKIRLAN